MPLYILDVIQYNIFWKFAQSIHSDLINSQKSRQLKHWLTLGSSLQTDLQSYHFCHHLWPKIRIQTSLKRINNITNNSIWVLIKAHLFHLNIPNDHCYYQLQRVRCEFKDASCTNVVEQQLTMPNEVQTSSPKVGMISIDLHWSWYHMLIALHQNWWRRLLQYNFMAK